MTVLSTTYFGPVVAGVYNLDAAWTADPVTGREAATFTGRLPKAQAEQLSELVNNPDAAPTIGGVKGVLVPFWSEAPKARSFIGWYLLTGEDHQPDLMGDGFRTVPFSLKGVYLGQSPTVVISRRAVPVGNDFSLTAASLVVSPIRPESDSGDEFVVSPGGTFATRAYDPNAYDPAVPTPANSAAIGLYTGTVTTTTDDMETVCFPRLAWSKDAPTWLTQQGGNVRAYDRRAGREVYGPHPFLESTDLLIDNGLVRAWVGNRGLVPFLNVARFDGTTWREEGTVQLGTTAVLRSERVEYLTSERVTVSLSIDGYGDALVSLYRGEPFFRIASPSTLIQPDWSGTPPSSWAASASNATAKFGKGLSSPADLKLLWPPTVSKNDWGRALWVKAPGAASALDSTGIFTIYDDSGDTAVELYFDGADNKFKLVMGSTTLASAAQTFGSGDLLLLGVRFDTTSGMALSVAAAGVAAHVTSAAVDPGTTGSYYETAYWTGAGTTWGDGLWGDGFWGGVLAGGVVIDNDMVFDSRYSDARFAALAVATTPLDGLGDDQASMVWYSHFDLAPIVTLAAESGGRRVDPVTDEWGFTKAVAFLDTDHTESAALLVGAATPDTAAELHAQVAAENDQSLRVR